MDAVRPIVLREEMNTEECQGLMRAAGYPEAFLMSVKVLHTMVDKKVAVGSKGRFKGQVVADRLAGFGIANKPKTEKLGGYGTSINPTKSKPLLISNLESLRAVVEWWNGSNLVKAHPEQKVHLL